VCEQIAKEQRAESREQRKTRDFSPSLIRDLWQRVLVDKTKNLDGTRKKERDKTFRQMTISSLPRPSVCLSSATHLTTQYTLKNFKAARAKVVLQHKSLCPSFCCSNNNNNFYSNMPTSVKG
jgi:hypothetical protein